MGANPAVSFIILNWNTKDLLLGCIGSIGKTVRNYPYEIWVVDNGSVDGSVNAVKETFPSPAHNIRIIENRRNAGFAGAMNPAMRLIESRYAVLLNSDVVLCDGAIDAMADFMEQTPDAALCSGQLLNADGTPQNSIAPFPSLLTELTNKSVLRRLAPSKYPGKETVFASPVPVDSVIGACMMVRKSAMDAVGLLDEDYFFFFEETDWCLRFQKNGFKVYHVPQARIYHLQGQSAGKVPVRSRIEYWRARYIYARKHWSITARIVLTAGLLVKAAVGLALNIVPWLFALVYLRPSQKRTNKAQLYGTLLVWHLLGRPASWGMSGK
ncbi:MAG: glycosyltransferase family 2 protein [Nitrospiraceae bacterium]|nr:glycosyltransferase family 2 protein [Nitrospiraceae bacterium]